MANQIGNPRPPQGPRRPGRLIGASAAALLLVAACSSDGDPVIPDHTHAIVETTAGVETTLQPAPSSEVVVTGVPSTTAAENTDVTSTTVITRTVETTSTSSTPEQDIVESKTDESVINEMVSEHLKGLASISFETIMLLDDGESDIEVSVERESFEDGNSRVAIEAIGTNDDGVEYGIYIRGDAKGVDGADLPFAVGTPITPKDISEIDATFMGVSATDPSATDKSPNPIRTAVAMSINDNGEVEIEQLSIPTGKYATWGMQSSNREELIENLVVDEDGNRRFELYRLRKTYEDGSEIGLVNDEGDIVSKIFADYGPESHLDDEDLREIIFVTAPAAMDGVLSDIVGIDLDEDR